MNKIFKVIWSKAKGCYIVVSEIAKNQTKGRGKRARQLALAAIVGTGVAMSTFTGVVYADGEEPLEQRVTAVEGRVTTIEGNISGVKEAAGKAETAATTATTAAEKAETAATTATTAADAANTAAANVNSKVESAETAATNAATAADNAQTAATNAETAAGNAQSAATDAATSASQAATDAGKAKTAVNELKKNFNDDGKAKSAVSAESADEATHATSADSATNATNATNDGNGKNIAETYATKEYVGELPSGVTATTVVEYAAEVAEAEKTRAMGVEGTIQATLGEGFSETNTVAGALATEKSRAEDAETTLQTNITAEETARKAQIGDLGKVGEADQTVKGYVDAEISKVNSAATDLTNRVSANETAIGNIRGFIGTLPEGTTATTVVGYIDNKIEGLDATVGNNTIETGKHVAVQVVEEDGVITGVTVSEEDIASAKLLGTADDDSTKQTAFGKIAANAKAISDEASRADAAEKANKAAIEAEVTRAKGAESALGVRIDGVNNIIGSVLSANGNYITTGNTINQNLSALDTAIGALDAEASYAHIVKTNSVYANITELDTTLTGITYTPGTAAEGETSATFAKTTVAHDLHVGGDLTVGDKITMNGATGAATIGGISYVPGTPASGEEGQEGYQAATKAVTNIDSDLNVTGDANVAKVFTVGTAPAADSGDANNQIIINGNTGSLSVGENVTVDATGAASFKYVVGKGDEAKSGSVEINKTAGIISGLTNITWTTADATNLANSNKAATEAQLAWIARNGYIFKDESDSKENEVSAPFGSTIEIAGDNNYISTEINKTDNGGKYTISMTDKPKFTNVTSEADVKITKQKKDPETGALVFDDDGKPVMETVDGTRTATFNSQGLTISVSDETIQNVSLTSAGLDNGGNRLKNIARAVDENDAVTLKQLTESQITLKPGANITLTPSKQKVGSPQTITISATDRDTTYSAGSGIILETTSETIIDEETGKPQKDLSKPFHKKDDQGKLMYDDNGDPVFDYPDLVVTKNEFSVNIGSDLKFAKGTDKIELADVVTIGPNNNITIDGQTGAGYITGLSNQSWAADGKFVPNRAATEAQLQALTDNGWKVTGDSGERNIVLKGGATTKDGEPIAGVLPALNIIGDTNNISTIVDDSGVKIHIDEDPTFKTVKITGVNTNKFWDATNTVTPDPDHQAAHQAAIDTGYLSSVAYFGNSGSEWSKRAVTGAQLYNAVVNMDAADRYVTNAYVNGFTLHIEQNNAKDFAIVLPHNSTDTGSGVTGNIHIYEDSDRNLSRDNWYAVEKVTLQEKDGEGNYIYKKDSTTYYKDADGYFFTGTGDNKKYVDSKGIQIYKDEKSNFYYKNGETITYKDTNNVAMVKDPSSGYLGYQNGDAIEFYDKAKDAEGASQIFLDEDGFFYYKDDNNKPVYKDAAGNIIYKYSNAFYKDKDHKVVIDDSAVMVRPNGVTAQTSIEGAEAVVSPSTLIKRNTTLAMVGNTGVVDGQVYASKSEKITNGQKFTVMDTAGNAVVIDDIASASVLTTTRNSLSDAWSRVNTLSEGFILKANSLQDEVEAGDTIEFKVNTNAAAKQNNLLLSYNKNYGDNKYGDKNVAINNIIDISITDKPHFESVTVKDPNADPTDKGSFGFDGGGIYYKKDELATTGKDYYVTKEGLSANGGYVKGVNTPAITDASTEQLSYAVNIATVKPIYDAVKKEYSVSSDNGSVKLKLLDQNFNYSILGDGKNITTSGSGTDIKVHVVDDPTFTTVNVGTDSKAITIGETKDSPKDKMTIDHLENTSWTLGQTPANYKDNIGGRAATENQLHDLELALLKKGNIYVGDLGSGITDKDLGASITVTGVGNVEPETADSNKIYANAANIGVSASGDALILKLNKDINLGDYGSLNIGNSKLDGSKLTITNGATGEAAKVTTTYSQTGISINDRMSVNALTDANTVNLSLGTKDGNPQAGSITLFSKEGNTITLYTRGQGQLVDGTTINRVAYQSGVTDVDYHATVDHPLATLGDGIKLVGDTRDTTVDKTRNELQVNLHASKNQNVVDIVGGKTAYNKITDTTDVKNVIVDMVTSEVKDGKGEVTAYNKQVIINLNKDINLDSKDEAGDDVYGTLQVGGVNITKDGITGVNSSLGNEIAAAANINDVRAMATIENTDGNILVNPADASRYGGNKISLARVVTIGDKFAAEGTKTPTNIIVDGENSILKFNRPLETNTNLHANLSITDGTKFMNNNTTAHSARFYYTDSYSSADQPLVHEMATLDDGIKFVGDSVNSGAGANEVDIYLNNSINITGGANTGLTDNNIGVVASTVTAGGVTSKTLNLKLKKDVDLTESGSLTIGGIVIRDADLTSGGVTHKAGIDAGGKAIYNMKSGIEIPIDTATNKPLYSLEHDRDDNGLYTAGDGWDNNAASIGDVKEMATKVEAGKDSQNHSNLTIIMDNSAKNTLQKTYTVSLNNVLKLGDASNQLIISSEKDAEGHYTRQISGLTNTTWESTSGKDARANHAATEGQLATIVAGTITTTVGETTTVVDNPNGGWGLSSGSNSVKADIGHTLNVAGDSNINTAIVNTASQKGVNITLNKDVDLTAGGSLKVAGAEISASSSTKNPGAVISGLASGLGLSDDHAATIGDVKNLATIIGDNNIIVGTKTDATTGQTHTALSLGETITIGSGDNTLLLDSKNGKVQFGSDSHTNKVVINHDGMIAIGTVATGKEGTAEDTRLVIDGGGTTKEISGLTNTVLPASESTYKASRAATEGQLAQLAYGTNDHGGWGLTAGGTDKIKANIGDTLAIFGDDADGTDATPDNIHTEVVAGKGIKISLNKKVVFGASADAVNQDHYVLIDGTDTVTNGEQPTGGRIQLGQTDANKILLNGTTGTITAGNKVVLNGNAGTGNIGNIKFNDTTTGTGTGAGTISGLSNTTWVNGTNGVGIHASKAATEAQLAYVMSATKKDTDGTTDINNPNGGWGLSDGTNSLKVNIGETIAINGDSTNISTAVKDGALTVSLNKDVNLGDGSLTIGNTTSSTVVNPTGIVINGDNGPSMTTAGINAGGKVVSNVASGQGNDNNAANIGDVKSLIQTSETNSTDYSLVANDNESTKGTTAGSYKVKDNKISLKVQDRNHTDNFETIVIEDVASAATLSGVTAGYIKDATASTDGKTLTLTKASAGSADTTITFNNIDTSVKSDAAYSVTKVDGVNKVTLKQANIDGTDAGKDIVITGMASSQDLADAAISYKANGVVPSGVTAVKLTDGLNFKDGTNTTATVEASGIVKYSLKDAIGLTESGSVTFGTATGSTKLNASGLAISGGPSVTTTGINAGGKQITDVASGFGLNGTDGKPLVGAAANIHDVESKISTSAAALTLGYNASTAAGAAKGTALNVKLSDGLNFRDGTNTVATVAANGVVTFDLASKIDLGASGEVKVGKSVINDDGITADAVTVNGTNGKNTVLNGDTIKVGDKTEIGNGVATFGASGTQVKIDGSTGDVAAKTVTINGTKLDVAAGAADVNNKATSRIKYGDHQVAVLTDGLTFSADTGDDVAKKLNEKLPIIGDGNVATETYTKTTNGVTESGIKVTLNDVITFKDSNNKEMKIDGTKREVIGLSNITWDQTNGAYNAGRAATEEQLHSAIGTVNTAISGLAEKTYGIKPETGDAVTKTLGNTIELVGANGNVSTKSESGKVKIALSNDLDLTKDGSLKFGTATDATTLNNSGLTVGSTSVGTTGINIGTSSITESLISLGFTTINSTGTATFGASTSANKVVIDGSVGTISVGTISTAGTGVSFSAAGTGSVGNIKFNQDADKAKNDEHKTTITGLTNKTWNQAGTYNEGRAATEEQLQAAISGVNTSLESKTFGIKASDGNTVAPKLGQTIEIVGANDNVSTKVEDGKVKIALSNDLNLTDKGSLSVGALSADKDGLTATAGTSSSLKVDSDSTTITKGTGNDANALKVDANGTTFTHGTGTSATSTTINGSTITAGDKVTLNGSTGVGNIGDIKFNDTTAGAGTISGLTNKTWDPTKDYSNSGLAATEAQLAQVAAQAGKSSSVSSANDNIKVNKKADGDVTNYEVKLGNNLKLGDATEDGSITLARKDGTSAEIGVVKKDGKTRIEYKDAEGNAQTVATLNDGMKYGGDSGEALNMKLNEQVNIKGGVSDASKLSEGNIGVVAGSNNTLNIKLSKELKGLEKVEVGDTTIDNRGLTVKGDGKKTNDISIKQGNVDMGGNVVSGIAPGKVSKDSTDAVNGAQMSAVVDAINGVGEGLNTVSTKVDKLGGRVNQVGARAAALAALHPLEFDPDEKLTFSAGYGHYHGESAGAIGAYYRPDEKVLLSISGTMTNKENMFNAGISFALDRNPHPSVSKPVMARQIVDLNNKVEALTQQNAEMMAAINNANTRQYTQNSFTKTDGNSMLTMVRMEFTNLPEGHWGYNYLKELISKGYLKSADANVEEGKLMSRYEFAKALYSAIVNGAPVDNSMGKGMDEFGREMDNIAKAARFRSDGLRAN